MPIFELKSYCATKILEYVIACTNMDEIQIVHVLDKHVDGKSNIVMCIQASPI